MIVPECPPQPFPSVVLLAAVLAAVVALAVLVGGLVGYALIVGLTRLREHRLQKLHRKG